MDKSKIFYAIDLIILVALTALHACAYFMPDLFIQAFPKSGMVESTSLYGISPVILTVLAVATLTVNKLKSSRNLYVLSGAFYTFGFMFFLKTIAAIPFLYLASVLFSQGKTARAPT